MSELFKKIEGNIVDSVLTGQVAFKALEFIRGRVYRAEFLDDSAGNTQYSTSPMPIPYGLFLKVFGKTFLKKNSKNKNRGSVPEAKDYKVFRAQNGVMMVLLPGGYKQWREKNRKSVAQVELTWSGRMMKNLGFETPAANKAELGFPSASEAVKAYYHHAGAGKNKVTHKFMDLTKKEVDELGELALQLIFQKLQ
ncbi:MAG: hypothetical protein AB1394_07885 [Bacteroidota bacterium]